MSILGWLVGDAVGSVVVKKWDDSLKKKDAIKAVKEHKIQNHTKGDSCCPYCGMQIEGSDISHCPSCGRRLL